MKNSTFKNKFTVCRSLFTKIIDCIRDVAFWLLVAPCLLPIFSNAQVGQWTWLHGSKLTGVLGNFGTQQTPSPTNNPPGLYEPCQWTDTSGLFWMFGGIDFNGNKYGDLWQYDHTMNEWTWMNGRGPAFVNDPGTYGTQGVASLNNIPPARSHGMATWTDKNDNLWFFGGSQESSLSFNDLWEYNIANDEWTWMNGPDTTQNPGHYGIQGMPDTANLPPARYEAVATWVDSAGDLWLFGGLTFFPSNSTYHLYNDLWRYNIATNTWTWMKGSNIPNNAGNYGTQTVESATALPPARASYAHLKDAHQNLWLFGGLNSSLNSMNDIWRYNPVTNNWVWLSGSKASGHGGVYGTKCIADSNNIPGARFENRACWTDKDGNLWFFGGFINQTANNAESNELWKYCIQTNQWTFINGDTIIDPAGNWGTILVPAATNKPDGRGGSDSWIDTAAGNLYMFGGAVLADLSENHADLWRFTIDTTCAVCAAVVLPTAGFQASDSLICAYDCINFTDHSLNTTSWIWSFPGAVPDSSTDENPQGICYYNPGTYDVKLIATSYKGSDVLTLKNYITVVTAPPTPVIQQLHNDTLYINSDTSYISYQWYLDTTLIAGATDTLLVITKGGDYNLKITNYNGCHIAVGITIVGIKEFSFNGYQFNLSPNPTGNELTITGNLKLETSNLKLNVYNVLGQNVYNEQLEPLNSKLNTVLDVSALPSGVYFLQIANESGSWIGRFVKE